MKKSISLLLILLFIYSMSACGDSEVTSAPLPQQTEEGQAVDLPHSPDIIEGTIPNVRISEVMVRNKAVIQDSTGSFPDWVEIENCSSEPVNISKWSLSDSPYKTGWLFPEGTVIGTNSCLLVFMEGSSAYEINELHTDFSLSSGETLCLSSANGNVVSELQLPAFEDNCSLAYDAEVTDYTVSYYPTPGYTNSHDSIDLFQRSRCSSGPIQINEVMVSNLSGDYLNETAKYDWVEIKNVSNEPVELSQFFLSDNLDEPNRYHFPSAVLKPGEISLYICSSTDFGYHKCTGFSLDSVSESLFLSDANGLIDYVSLVNIPYNSSYGRIDAESGFYYFDSPSPGKDNSGGSYRRVSESPVISTRGGVFGSEDEVTVEIEAEGSVYYTLDGTLPTTESRLYSGPFTIDETSVVKAISVNTDEMPSRAATETYVFDSSITLPIVSIAADNPSALRHVMFVADKSSEVSGSISYYDGDSSFTENCGLAISGQYSLSLPKKNIKIRFRGAYGEPALDYDIFGEEITEFSSLSLRAGQDSSVLMFSQQMWQNLCMETTDRVYTQYSKFCILYVNGEYYGIYCLQEDISKQYYASHARVSVESVSDCKVPDELDSVFYNDVYIFCSRNNMSTEENYQHVCDIIDIDSFIDWVLIEGHCNNTDLFRNVRMFKSDENGGKWQFVLFDLDAAMDNDYSAFDTVFGYTNYSNSIISTILRALVKNDEFRGKMLTRYAQIYNSSLSDEMVSEQLEFYYNLLSPEVSRDWLRWGYSEEQWYHRIKWLTRTFTEKGWQEYARDCLCRYLDVTPEEKLFYFG